MSSTIKDIELIDTSDFREHLSNVTQQGKRIWIYPRIEIGTLYKMRSWLSYVLLICLFAGPFLEFDGHPLFLFNILERKFIFFGVLFVPQDFHLVAIGLLTFIVFVILFTVVYGRVWCGWACPQTIFMEMLFRKIEVWIEGDHKAQMRLDASPWTQEKIIKKSLKHFIFFVLSFAISNTFLAYIIGKKELLAIVQDNPFDHLGGLMAILIFTGVFYFVFARFRELVCIIICPYGRLQGVLLDKNSIVVAYDDVRGEPRGKLKKQPSNQPIILADSQPINTTKQGDCIDCGICVQVCPTGIDIRNGTQLECINCTACIDACNVVMDKVKKPRGLIRFDSLNGIASRQKLGFTTRIAAYSTVLLLLLGVLVFLLVTRSDIETTILRASGLTFQKQPNGMISNLYNIEIVNKTFHELPIELQTNNPNARIKFVGKAPASVNQDDMVKTSFFIEIPQASIKDNKTPLDISVQSGGKVIDKVKTSFMAPVYE
ncbi:MAG: cytochrome c oxidase accessory protein CcoG [Spirosomataceae bacterium]